MTKEQIEMAETMLESGCTFAQVGRNLGCSPQYIRFVFGAKFSEQLKKAKQNKRLSRCKYPAILQWIFDNDMTIEAFAGACYLSITTIKAMLYKGLVSEMTVEQVLRVTGMSFEEAFKNK